ncbi:MAG: hypothetical protein K6G40_10460 [Eubacterium sp.]|nr:hypothetical protein [Eubacterium sp.]
MTNEEQAFLERYKKELEAANRHTPKMVAEYYKALGDGDDSVIGDLTEALMPRVLEIVLEKERGKLFVGDLIQEGNLATFVALSQISAKPAEKPYDEYIEEAVAAAVDLYIEENGAVTQTGERVAARLNEVVEAMEDLEKEYGNAFSIDDVAEQTGLDAEEISNLFKLAGEDIGGENSDA